MIFPQPRFRDEKGSDYLVLSELNLEELAESACLQSNKGWEPTGGPLYARGMFYQAVYRKPDSAATEKEGEVAMAMGRRSDSRNGRCMCCGAQMVVSWWACGLPGGRHRRHRYWWSMRLCQWWHRFIEH